MNTTFAEGQIELTGTVERTNGYVKYRTYNLRPTDQTDTLIPLLGLDPRRLSEQSRTATRSGHEWIIHESYVSITVTGKLVPRSSLPPNVAAKIRPSMLWVLLVDPSS